VLSQQTGETEGYLWIGGLLGVNTLKDLHRSVGVPRLGDQEPLEEPKAWTRILGQDEIEGSQRPGEISGSIELDGSAPSQFDVVQDPIGGRHQDCGGAGVIALLDQKVGEGKPHLQLSRRVVENISQQLDSLLLLALVQIQLQKHTCAPGPRLESGQTCEVALSPDQIPAPLVDAPEDMQGLQVIGIQLDELLDIALSTRSDPGVSISERHQDTPRAPEDIHVLGSQGYCPVRMLDRRRHAADTE
jgi:hypothetical protein